MLADIVLLFPMLHSAVKAMFSVLQSMMQVLFLITGTLVLYLNTADYRILFLCVGQLLLFSVGNYLLQTIIEPVSNTLLKNVFLLLSFSFIELERLDMNKAIRQFAFVIVALIIATVLLGLLKKATFIQDIYLFYGIIGIILLSMVLVGGSYEYGAKLSISFGNISVQPSEFVKLSYIFFIASVCTKIKGFKGFVVVSIGSFLHVVILAMSNDFGTALIFLTIYVFLVFIATGSYMLLGLEAAIGIAGAIFASKTFSHIQTRILAWKDPLAVVEKEGYQISQSLFAIGSGGWFGSGLYQGMPNKIPVVTKDFIFASISEEMGAIVGLELMIIYVCVLIYVFEAAFMAKDRFFMIVSTGYGISLSIQAILNIGGVTNFIPSTGVTLPFISYGGSSLLALFIGFVIVESTDDLGHEIKKAKKKR